MTWQLSSSGLLLDFEHCCPLSCRFDWITSWQSLFGPWAPHIVCGRIASQKNLDHCHTGTFSENPPKAEWCVQGVPKAATKMPLFENHEALHHIPHLSFHSFVQIYGMSWHSVCDRVFCDPNRERKILHSTSISTRFDVRRNVQSPWAIVQILPEC